MLAAHTRTEAAAACEVATLHRGDEKTFELASASAADVRRGVPHSVVGFVTLFPAGKLVKDAALRVPSAMVEGRCHGRDGPAGFAAAACHSAKSIGPTTS